MEGIYITKVKIAIKDLAEFIYRQGDINSSYQGHDPKVLEEGQRLHKNYQLSQTEAFFDTNFTYKKEVSVKETIPYKNISFEIKGRLDGLILSENSIVIEEIKSTSKDLSALSFSDNKAYMAQALLYAYLLSKDIKDDILISVSIVYINRFTEDVKICKKDFSKIELLDFFMDTLEKYYLFCKANIDNIEQMETTGKAVPFPYDTYRPSQKKFISAVYTAIVEKTMLFAEAPTGVGKTLSTLYPSIKALSNKYGKKIFYLTAKTITKKVCLESLYMLEDLGFSAVCLMITSKESICINDKINCTPSSCKFSIGHFDKINDVILKIITTEKIIDENVVKKYANEYEVCPYYLQLELMEFSSIIIADYNYVYNPTVCFTKYFDKEKNDFIILVDEAHNLEARSRDFFSASIRKSNFSYLENNIESTQVKKLCRTISKNMTLLCKDSFYETDMPKSLINTLYDLNFILSTVLQEEEIDDKILDIYFSLDYFLKTSQYFDKKYRTTYEKMFSDIEITLFCIDTSTRFFKANTLNRSTVFFSATLTPINFFAEIYGGSKDDYFLTLDTPFDSKNQLLIIDNKISTYYKDRANNYDIIAKKLELFISEKRGNYFAFFPSYDFLEEVLSRFDEKKADILVQSKDMSATEKIEFLENFTDNRDKSLLAFLVIGGSFSEGVNLPLEKLIGVFIVGVGVSKMNFKNDVIKDYYDETINRGYEFSYMYSGMNKVLQSIGRLIRTEKDKGIILLIDTRYTKADYKGLFPKHLKTYNIITENDKLTETIANFWNDSN